MLNENNLQAAFQFNASDGSFVVEPIIGEITLSENDVRVVRQSGSDKMCIDLSYSIDAAPSDLIFKINNQICSIKVVAQRTDLVNINLTNNEVAIITNDPNFRTLVWTSTSNIGKHMYYEIKTINSGISNWQLNEIATKLNALNPGEIESKLTDLEGKVITSEALINTLDADLTVVEENLSEANDKIGLIETAIEVLPTLSSDVSELKNKTSNLESKTAGITRADTTTTITDSLKLDSTFEVVGKSTVADLEVKGNIEVADTTVITGVLKDDKGFKYLKIKRGNVNPSGTLYQNMAIEYNGTSAVIKGDGTVMQSQQVNSHEVYNLTVNAISCITKINRLLFTNSSKTLAFYITATKESNTSLSINFKNISNGNENIAGSTFTFTIECEINPNDPNILW